jgi:hypothetical protein
MKYDELIKLGFKRIDENDKVWFNEFGYEYFRLELKLSKRHYIDWDIQKQTCEVVHCNREHDILSRWEVDNIELLKNIINLFGKLKDEPITTKGTVTGGYFVA